MAETYSVEAYLKATGVDQFTKAFDDAGNSVDGIGKTTKKADSSIKNILKTIAGIAAAVGVFNTLRNAVDGAISRYDTLNNFPKVMEQMGFSATQSQKAIERLSDGIQGLPTTLDDVASTAQRIAIMTGDIDGAVETTLALNNAFISSGSSSADASRGLEQYVQMLSKGEVDLQSWRTLQETMGVALNDVAKAFGFVGKSAQNDLYDALKEGHITFDEFNAKLIELSDETGGFAERALTASGGIRTAWANMNTAVVRGVTNIITAIDKALADTRLKSIQNIIETIGQSAFVTLDTIANMIGPAINALVFLYDAIKPLAPVIIGLTSAIAAFMALNWMATAMSVLTLSEVMINLYLVMFRLEQAIFAVWRLIAAHPFIAIISAVIGLATMIVYLWKTNEKFREIVTTAWEAVQSVISATIDLYRDATTAVANFVRGLAPEIVDGFNSAIETTTSIGRTIGGYFMTAAEHVGAFIGVLATGTVNAFNSAMDWLGQSIETVSNFLSDLRKSIDIKDVIANVVGPLTTMATLFLGLASPIGWAIKGFALLATQTSVFGDLMSVFAGDMSIGQFLNNFASEIANLITSMAESSAEMITKGSELITGFVNGISEKLPEIMKVGTEVITNFVEGLATTIGEVAPVAVEVINAFIESIAVAIPEIATIGIEIITTLVEAIATNLPIVLGVGIQIITTLIETIATLIPLLIQAGVTILITLIEAIVTSLPMLIEVGVQIITTLIETIVTMLPLVIQVAIELILTIVETVIMMLPTLIETFVTLVMTLIDTILSLLPLVVDVALTLIITIVEVLVENIPLILDAGIQILMALIEGIITILPVLIESIIMIIESLLMVIIENLPLVIDAGIQILMALIDGIVSIVPALLTAGIELLLALVQTIIGLLPHLVDAGVQILFALIDGIISIVPQLLVAGIQLIIQLVAAILGMLPQLLSAGKDLILALIDGILSLLGSILTAGKDLIDSLISGITGMFSNLLSVGKDVAQEVIDGVTGMASSFLEAGANIVTSIADGIKGAVGKVTSAIGTVTDKIRGYLPFSPAKEGALTDIMDIQLVQSIAEAIKKGERYAVAAMASVSDAIYGEMPQFESMDIARQINGIHARSQRQFSYDYTNELGINRQPARITLVLGNNEFEAFVDDINEVNAINAELRRF